MRIPIGWLKEYVEVPNDPAKLAEDLAMFAHDVESIDKVNDDTVLDLEITPNRGDCLSILGIARQVAAMYESKLKTKEFHPTEDKLEMKIEVKITDPKICPRFTARIIDNIQVQPSPDWMKEKLVAYGFRPINNIVDITNYVMVETGQPLHAFDYHKIKNGLMNIRQAKEGEEVMTLDGQNRVLNEGAIIIEDDEKIYDLAGIMGGFKSEVDKNTTTIVLQGAIFDPTLIRKTSKTLNHVTDASYRYERGVDYQGTSYGVDMAATLIKDQDKAAKIGQLINIESKPIELPKIKIDYEKINRLLGTSLNNDEINKALERLYFKVDGDVAVPPSFRYQDINLWQDLAEEVARIYGFNNFKRVNFDIEKSSENGEYNLREYVKDYLTDFNYVEVYTYSFTDKEIIDRLNIKLSDCIEVSNPISPETQYLRPSLLPSLLGSISKNPWAPEIKIFEIGKVFLNEEEHWQLGIASVGKDETDLKKRAEFLGIKASIQSVDKSILDQYKIRRPVKYLLIDPTEIISKPQAVKNNIKRIQYKKISKFPPTVRDLAFILQDFQDGELICDFIKDLNSKILIVEKFDEYLFDNKTKNCAYHVWIQDLEKPVNEEEAEDIIKNIVSKVNSKFNTKLRS